MVKRTRRKLKELNLIDDFLANAMATSTEYSQVCFRRILSVLLNKEIGDISVKAQNIFIGDDTDLRGIRLDVEITEYDDDPTTIYDIEPHLTNDTHYAKHNRYYQAKIDSHYVPSGLKDFSKMHNLYVITITNFDIFKEDYMLYTFKQTCIEEPSIEYEDGLRFLYFNTKGTKGGSESILNMLRYMENSTADNAVDEATKEISKYVEEVKNNAELETRIMTLQDKIDIIREEGKEEGREEGIKEGLKIGNQEGKLAILVAQINDGEISIESAAKRMNMSKADFKEYMNSELIDMQ